MRTIVETSSNKPTNLPYPHPNLGELNILIRNWGWQLWGNPRGEWGEGGEGGNSVTYKQHDQAMDSQERHSKGLQNCLLYIKEVVFLHCIQILF